VTECCCGARTRACRVGAPADARSLVSPKSRQWPIILELRSSVLLRNTSRALPGIQSQTETNNVSWYSPAWKCRKPKRMSLAPGQTTSHLVGRGSAWSPWHVGLVETMLH
jgi:hypothetical protein